MVTDKRPRFGWVEDLDEDPQTIWEKKCKGATHVVVIPLPYKSPKLSKRIREFAKTLSPL
jgi:hypothetical protein